MRFRQQPRNRAADDHQRVARSAGAQGVGRARGRHLRHLRRHPRDGRQPHRRHGVPDYLAWNWRSKAGLPVVCVPGCPIHPDNLSETILYLLHQAAGHAPTIPLDDKLRPAWLFGDGRGLRSRRLLRAG